MNDLFLFRSAPLGRPGNPVAQFLRLMAYAQQADEGLGQIQACAAFTDDGAVAFFIEDRRDQS